MFQSLTSSLAGVMSIIVVPIEPLRPIKRDAVWFDKIEPIVISVNQAKDEPVHSLAQHTPMRKIYDRQTRT